MVELNPTIVFLAPLNVAIEDRPVPTPGEGELLIRTRCTLISTGTELTILSGDVPPASRWAQFAQFPRTAGYNNIGDVIDGGPGVARSWIGQRVATYGAHARYVTALDSSALPVRPDVADEQAVFFTIAEIVMNGVRRGAVRWAEAVVVHGVGLLGQFAVRLCRLCGARPVIAVDVADSRLGYLPDDVAVFPVNSAREDLAACVSATTKGRMADVAFEVTGNPDLIPEELAVLREQGRLVVLSSPGGETLFDFHDLCNAPSYTIIGAHNSSHPPHATPGNPWTLLRHRELFFDLLADGELEVTALISHQVPYGEASGAYEMLLADRSHAMGVVLAWGD